MKYQRVTHSGYKDIAIRINQFVAKTLFLYENTIISHVDFAKMRIVDLMCCPVLPCIVYSFAQYSICVFTALFSSHRYRFL